jgi:sugar/nucleoside kinase (ribokinase family)
VARGPQPAARAPDYVAIGHLAIDRTPHGDVLGGTVLYAGLAAARFGARVGILTRANFDAFTDEQRSEFARIADEIEIISQSSDSTTTFTNRDVAGRRQQTLHAVGGPIDVSGLPPLWRSAPVIHLAPLAQEIEPRQVSRLSPGLMGATIQGWMRQWDERRFGAVHLVPPRLPRDVVARIDAIVLSNEEFVLARELVGEVGRRGLAVVTQGAQGARIIDRGRTFEAPAFRVTPVDSTGAGDVFAGVLFAARALGEPTTTSIRHAAAAAALSVAGRGVLSVPDREAIENLVERTRG